MNPSSHSILIGLPVHTVAEIADYAGSLKCVARSRSDGKVAGYLAKGRGGVVEGTEGDFISEAVAVAHMDELVSACLAWRHSHKPACLADASFAC